MRRTIRWAALAGVGAARCPVPAGRGRCRHRSAASYPGSGGYPGTGRRATVRPDQRHHRQPDRVVSADRPGWPAPVNRVDTGGLGVAWPAPPSTIWPRRGVWPTTHRRRPGGGQRRQQHHLGVPDLRCVRRLPRVVPSGGTIPVSVALRGDLLYVLNAGGPVRSRATTPTRCGPSPAAPSPRPHPGPRPSSSTRRVRSASPQPATS